MQNLKNKVLCAQVLFIAKTETLLSAFYTCIMLVLFIFSEGLTPHMFLHFHIIIIQTTTLTMSA